MRGAVARRYHSTTASMIHDFQDCSLERLKYFFDGRPIGQKPLFGRPATSVLAVMRESGCYDTPDRRASFIPQFEDQLGKLVCRRTRTAAKSIGAVSHARVMSKKGEGMNSAKRTARIAGLLYLANGVTGFFGIIYVPSRLIVSGNAAATANNILASERLFRLGIVSELICAVEFVFVIWALYRLLGGVNKTLTSLMVILGVAFSDYVRECPKRDRCPISFARRGFPVRIRPIATRSPGHVVLRFASLRVRYRLDLWPLVFPLRGSCI
jgi:Domain of unknown function (DUF4386)